MTPRVPFPLGKCELSLAQRKYVPLECHSTGPPKGMMLRMSKPVVQMMNFCLGVRDQMNGSATSSLVMDFVCCETRID